MNPSFNVVSAGMKRNFAFVIVVTGAAIAKIIIPPPVLMKMKMTRISDATPRSRAIRGVRTSQQRARTRQIDSVE